MQNYGLVLEVVSRQRKQDGSWREPRPAKIQSAHLRTLPDEADRRILALLMGARDVYGLYGSPYVPYGQAPQTYRLSSPLQDTVLPLVCATGRCMLRLGGPARDLRLMRWDDGPPWELWLAVRRVPRTATWSPRTSVGRTTGSPCRRP